MDSQFIEKWLPAIMAMSFPLFVTFGLGIITYFLDITKLVSFHFMVRNITIEYSYTVDLILSYFATHGIMGNYSV